MWENSRFNPFPKKNFGKYWNQFAIMLRVWDCAWEVVIDLKGLLVNSEDYLHIVYTLITYENFFLLGVASSAAVTAIRRPINVN